MAGQLAKQKRVRPKWSICTAAALRHVSLVRVTKFLLCCQSLLGHILCTASKCYTWPQEKKPTLSHKFVKTALCAHTASGGVCLMTLLRGRSKNSSHFKNVDVLLAYRVGPTNERLPVLTRRKINLIGHNINVKAAQNQPLQDSNVFLKRSEKLLMQKSSTCLITTLLYLLLVGLIQVCYLKNLINHTDAPQTFAI